MKDKLKLKMFIGFTVFFFSILALLVGLTTFSIKEYMHYKDLHEFNVGLEEVKRMDYDIESPKFLKEMRDKFGGMVIILNEENDTGDMQIRQETLDEVINELNDSDSYYTSNDKEMVYAGRLNESEILLNLKSQSIFNDTSTMINILLGVTSVVIFTILLLAAYFYINYFERKMTFQAQTEILYSLGKTADAHFGENGAHIERVSYMMYRFAKTLGFSKKHCEMLKIASTMHDIGKIAIPDSILKKPGRLSDDEMIIMQTHTTEGKKILGDSQLPIINMARSIAQHHHERMDGRGYPDGLEGDQIPEYAKMMAIVDVYDALTNDRVYKKAFKIEVALDMMNQESGKQFDHNLLEIFVNNISYIVGEQIDLNLLSKDYIVRKNYLVT